jgi:hypothetical protein
VKIKVESDASCVLLTPHQAAIAEVHEQKTPDI